LRPVLRPVVADPKISVVSRPAARYLSEMLVVDTPSAMRYVARDDVQQWGVSVEEAFAAAHRNMARTVTNSLDSARKKAGAGTATSAITLLEDDGDAYLTSLPLIEGWLTTMGRIAGGRALAFPTSNNALFLTFESQDPQVVGKAAEIAEKSWRDAPRSISPAPLTADDDGNLVLYLPPEDHPAHAAIKHATILLALNAYDPQTEYLRATAGPEDPFPAALRGFRSPEGKEITVATWTDSIVSLLPEADIIALPKEGGGTMLIPWSVVDEEVGLTPADGYHPARYRVGAWPAEDVMARMATHAE